MALGGFGKFSICKNKNKNFAGLEPAEVDIRFHQRNTLYLTQLIEELFSRTPEYIIPL